MRSINTKKEMYKLHMSGALGNRLRIYDSVCDFAADRPPEVKYWTIRGLSKGRSKLLGPFRPEEWPDYTTKALELMGPGNFVISETTHGNSVVLQGELGLFPECGWYLRYTKEDVYLKYLNEVEYQDAQGVAALAIVRAYSDCANHLLNLCRWYGSQSEPCVVEFSVLKHRCGIYNQRTVIWEVRNGY